MAYRYEEPLERNGITKYPDFTIEDDDAGETYYWEHLGMLGNPIYQKRWNEKLAWLESQGIIPKEEGGGPKWHSHHNPRLPRGRHRRKRRIRPHRRFVWRLEFDLR